VTCRSVPVAGGVAIVCGRDQPAPPCAIPGCGRPHTRLCDHPVTRGGKVTTCDVKICDGHATSVGPERDYCPAHANATRPAGPVVINRNRYLPTPGFGPERPRTGRERRPPLPKGAIYVGRGSAVGNPYRRHEHPGEDPEGRPMALALFRRWVWERVKARDRAVLALLGSIREDSALVCSCAPKACHADEVAALWRWLQLPDQRAIWAACREAATSSAG
jgi:hypothetical protein